MKKIVLIDGQGGKLGSLLAGRLKAEAEGFKLYAVGTNSIATAAMLKASADFGATGENPTAVHCRDADVIAGPIGIIAADALYGEVTPAMAAAVAQSRARKVLLPINRCGLHIVGVREMPVAELIDAAVRQILSVLQQKD